MPREIEVKSILNKAKRRDSWFLDDYTINLYSSCSFNCLYCYIRGSKYGTNLETSLSAKINAIDLLEKQLASRAKKGQHGIIVMSSATDPYLPIEKDYQLTRRALEVIAHYRFPLHVITKSHLIERDVDLLKKIKETAILPANLEGKLGSGVIISFSFSTLDDAVARVFEPGATRPTHRVETIAHLLENDFFVGISLMPLLPWISDTREHLEQMFATFSSLGAKYALPASITLFGQNKADSKTLVLGAIKKHYPHLLSKYEAYFKESTQLPDFYNRAFYRKMKELSKEYSLPDSILQASQNLG